VDVFDAAGIVADNVQVKADLTAIGGGAAVALTRGTVSADGKSAAYTTSFKVPSSAALGTSNLPFTVTGTSASVVTKVAQTVYQAYLPAWKSSVQGAVTAVVSNGPATYVATDAGNVYAFNNADGAPVPTFGGGSGVNVGESVTRGLLAANGRLYVPGATHLFILDLGSGAQTGSAAIPQPSAAAAYSMDATTVFVGGGDNKVHALDANTGAQKFASADLGGAVNDPAIGPSFATASGFVLAAGTSPASGGAIVMLDPSDLTQAYPPIADPKGAVRSKAAFGLQGDGVSSYFVIGGASGLWGVNADDGSVFSWPTDATHGGNPYATPTPVDADPTITATPAGAGRIEFADTSGNFYIILAADGGKLSFGGVPANLTTPPGTGGFADGAGIVSTSGVSPTDNTTAVRIAYLGSDNNDRRFFAVNTLPDDSTYGVTPQSLSTFDPNDTATFPGETPGGFTNVPAVAGDKIVVGSSAGRVYGFPSLVVPGPYVASVTPASGATGVPAGQVVSVTFSQAVTPGFTGTVRLLQNGADVPGGMDLSGDGMTLSFTPSAPLTDKKSYVFTVQGFTNADGTIAVPAFSSTFYTGVPPAVQGDINGDGSFNLNDVKEALRIAAGLKSATAQAVTASGNKVTAGKITVEDAVFLEQVLAGKAAF
jgi:hypothetical protein